jgi:hypothetical protein
VTREEAIKILDEWAWMTSKPSSGGTVVFFDTTAEGMEDVLDMAISALREQGVTDTNVGCKGCEYCNGLLKTDMEDFTMPNASKQEYDIVTIRFCPMCGRRLEEV